MNCPITQMYDTAYWPGNAITLIVRAHLANRLLCVRQNPRTGEPDGAEFYVDKGDVVITTPQDRQRLAA